MWKAGGGSCIAALCWNKSVEQRSATCISQEWAQTAATGLHCSPTAQGKKGLKGLCISGHYVSAHAAHVNLLRVTFPTSPSLCLSIGTSPWPSGHQWWVFFTFPLQIVSQLLQKWQLSCHKVMAGCGKSPNDDAVRPPGLRTVVTSSICQAPRGIAADSWTDSLEFDRVFSPRSVVVNSLTMKNEATTKQNKLQ